MLVILSNCIATQSFGYAIATLVPNVRLAQIAGSLLLQTTAASTGYYTTLPRWLNWYMLISMPRYCFEGLLRAEFSPLDAFECTSAEGDAFMGPYLCPLEKSLIVDDLKQRGVQFAEVGYDLQSSASSLILLIFAATFRVTVYLGLRWRKQTQWRQSTGSVANVSSYRVAFNQFLAFLPGPIVQVQPSDAQPTTPAVRSALTQQITLKRCVASSSACNGEDGDASINPSALSPPRLAKVTSVQV
uniref:ABC-2 type transporter transmembrane domain-containing protein n=1 Tax=Haptolina brevifila TaxID=156173 RepID=A0A7S2IMN1_9EUKA